MTWNGDCKDIVWCI